MATFPLYDPAASWAGCSGLKAKHDTMPASGATAAVKESLQPLDQSQAKKLAHR